MKGFTNWLGARGGIDAGGVDDVVVAWSCVEVHAPAMRTSATAIATRDRCAALSRPRTPAQ
jgi:hypothetical protein